MENNNEMEINNLINQEIENEDVNVYRICTECGVDELTNKFKPKGKKCIKCYSRKNNLKMGKEYFKKYYSDRKVKKVIMMAEKVDEE
jgi:hypothetical protein